MDRLAGEIVRRTYAGEDEACLLLYARREALRALDVAPTRAVRGTYNLVRWVMS